MSLKKLKTFIITLIFLIGITKSYQATITKTYSTPLLRQAKAAEILSFLKKSDNTCTNFYKNVCGNWKLTHPATYDKQKTSYFQQIHNSYIYKCNDLLKDYKDSNDFYQILIRFYESCVNNKKTKTEDFDAIIEILDLKGGWPVLQSANWYDNGYDWLKTVADIRRNLSLDIFIGLEIVPDLELKGIQRIKIGAPTLPLGNKLKYLNSRFEAERFEYKEEIANKLRKYFSNMSTQWSNEVAQQILDIEIQLAKGLSDNQTLTFKDGVQEKTISELKTNYARFVDLGRYLNIILSKTITEQIYEFPKDYFQNLVNIIEKTPKIHIANYTIWRVLDKLVFEIEKNNEPNHEIWCTKQLIKYFPNLMEDMYDHFYDVKSTGQRMISIFNDIKNVFKTKLENSTELTWMSAQTREKAKEKLKTIIIETVSYENMLAGTNISQIFYDIKIDKYYENLFRILQWKTKNDLNKLNNVGLINSIINVEQNNLPFYEFNKNKISIPIEFVQLNVLWSDAYPASIKFGTLGVLLAQQMLRGFFGEGCLYDEYGRRNKWWDNETDIVFKQFEDCFIGQYDNYRFQGKIVKDVNSKSKAIIDAGSINLAFEAYIKWRQSATDLQLIEDNLPNISNNYKSVQLFFIAFGQMNCADYYQYSIEQYHELPERLRVNGALINSKYFSQEFNCPIDTKMNPKIKCQVFSFINYV